MWRMPREPSGRIVVEALATAWLSRSVPVMARPEEAAEIDLDGGIAEAQMHRDRAGDAVERAVERLEAVLPRLVGMLLHPRLVDLHHVGAGGEQILDLGIDGGGVIHRHRFFVLVVIVLRLLAHGERSGHGSLDLAAGIGAQHLQVANLDGVLAADRADDARHRYRLAAAVDRGAGIFDIDAVERGGEAVGIAFAPLLAVGDDIEPGALLIADGEDGGVILCRFKLVRRDQPEILGAHARHLLRQP